LTGDISPESGIKNSKIQKNIFWRFPVAKSEGGKKEGRNCQMFICDFHCVAKDIEG
jgi:hypothetical protein